MIARGASRAGRCDHLTQLREGCILSRWGASHPHVAPLRAETLRARTRNSHLACFRFHVSRAAECSGVKGSQRRIDRLHTSKQTSSRRSTQGLRPPFLCYGAPLPATGLSDPIKPIPLRFYESCPLGDQHFKEINNFKATQSNVAGITALLGADSILTSCTSLHYLTAAIKKPAGTKWIIPCEYNATSGGLYSVQVGGISPSCRATSC